MILTDKAKEDFIKWSRKEYDKDLFCAFTSMPKTSQYALIIEWFDSVGIFIQIDFENREPIFSYYIFNYKNICSGEDNAKTRSEATQQAILKANEIYNNLNTEENEK